MDKQKQIEALKDYLASSNKIIADWLDAHIIGGNLENLTVQEAQDFHDKSFWASKVLEMYHKNFLTLEALNKPIEKKEDK